MKRSRSVVLLALMSVGLVFAWQTIRANDDESSPSTTGAAFEATQLDLLNRIEALEKRIVKLEAETLPVRQADNKETRTVPAPRLLPQTAKLDNEAPPRKTNGTTWRIRMLSHRSSSDRPN